MEKKIRGLAWVALRWAATVQPRVIMLENVEEFVTWGPLAEGPDGKMRPCPKNKGREFKSFTNALRRHGYAVEWRELRACDFGAPTTRKRLFLIARRDGRPITWPTPTHGRPDHPDVSAGRLKPWRTAAECLDFSLPCSSIFERARPLADATCRRIAKGIMRYVVNAAEPFIVNTRNGERQGQAPRVRGINDPAWTITAQGSQGALVTAFLAKHYGGVVGYGLQGEPLHTVTSSDHHSLVTSNLIKLRNNCTGQDNREPLHTITGHGEHFAEVRAFLIKYYGADQDPRLEEPLHTITTRDRFGLVTVAGEDYAIADIGLRMLAPAELYRAQGFPADYIIEWGIDASGARIPLTKTAQVRMCGNSVCPPLAAALVRANVPELAVRRIAA